MHTLPFRSRLVATLAAALTLAFLAGCEGFAFQTKPETPLPTGALNSDCVASCDLKKSQCEQRQAQRERECQSYRSQIGADTGACIARFGSHCARPTECLGAVTEICEIQRRDCLMDCRVAPAARDGTPTAGTTPGAQKEPTL